MQVGAFELRDPVPQLRQPHLFLSLRPWIDVGSVGTGTLQALEEHFDAKELGRLRRPSVFYDLTRYRPQLYRVEGERIIELPSTIVKYAQTPGRDFLFVHALEPHLNGEDFVDSVMELAARMGVSRYCQIGAMYGSTPHTRPLVITGQATEQEVQEKLRGILTIRRSNYEGPTSVMGTVTDQLQRKGISTVSFMVQLPPYVQLEEDSNGQERMLRLVSTLYDLNMDVSELEHQGKQQYREIDRAVQADPQIKSMVRRLEEAYDAQHTNMAQPEESRDDGTPPTRLAPDVERFLNDLEKRRRGENS
jgi:predicted ATP-grasp superfamily ATP-dependent carboligase